MTPAELIALLSGASNLALSQWVLDNPILTPMPIDTQQALSTSADVESNFYPVQRGYSTRRATGVGQVRAGI